MQLTYWTLWSCLFQQLAYRRHTVPLVKMAICNDCLELLEHDHWQAKMTNREIVPLVQSCKHCSFCRFLCGFFEIPIDSIRNGTEWPSIEQMWSTDNQNTSPQPPGFRFERLVGFKVTIDCENSLRSILGELIPKGPFRSLSKPRPASLPLGWDSANYRDSDNTLGICTNSAGM